MTEKTPDRTVPSPDAFRFHIDVEVRFRDLDAMGHVNNAVYFTYLEIARGAYVFALTAPGTAAPAPAELLPFILAEASCRFLAPVTLGQTVRVHVRTCRLGDRSFDFEYLLTDGATGRPVATGRSVQVAYDYAAGRTQALPEALRLRLEAFEARPSV